MFEATGSLAALIAPNAPNLGQSSGLLTPFHLSPSVPVTNVAPYGYALNVATSPPDVAAAQAHLGRGISSHTIHGYHTWNGAGALTPIDRFATMFSGAGTQNANGTEWYFPQRLADDTAAVAKGNANPAQPVLDVDSTMGHRLPRRLLIYAFGTSLGKQRQNTYAHNDPAGAYPHNAFLTGLIGFLKRVG